MANGIFQSLFDFGATLAKKFLVGLAGVLSKEQLAASPLVRRLVTERKLSALRDERPSLLKWSETEWSVQRVSRSSIGKRLPANQMYAVDVVLVGPDGQTITIQSLVMPTGRAFDEDFMRRRLAAELKRLENQGAIKPIGNDASGYVDRSVIDYDVYKYTISPIKRG